MISDPFKRIPLLMPCDTATWLDYVTEAASRAPRSAYDFNFTAAEMEASKRDHVCQIGVAA